MYSLFISVLAAIASFSAFYYTDSASTGWSVFWGFMGFFFCMFVIGLIIRRKVAAVMKEMERKLTEKQRSLQARMKQYQQRPTGDPLRFQQQLLQEQHKSLQEALEATCSLERFRNWIPYMSRQIATTRLQFYYQLKNFRKVDELLPKAIIVDPMTACMKMARLFSSEASLEEIEKCFKKAKSRCRYNQSGLLYALMSWIYVRQKQFDKACNILQEGCKENHCDEGANSTLKHNFELLANNRVQQFSNAGFGDQWYALFLEEPKVRYERRAPTRFSRFG